MPAPFRTDLSFRTERRRRIRANREGSFPAVGILRDPVTAPSPHYFLIRRNTRKYPSIPGYTLGYTLEIPGGTRCSSDIPETSKPSLGRHYEIFTARRRDLTFRHSIANKQRIFKSKEQTGLLNLFAPGHSSPIFGQDIASAIVKIVASQRL